MKFEVTLANVIDEEVKLTCDVWTDWFDLGLDMGMFERPEITKYNVYDKKEAFNRFILVSKQIDKQVNNWNKLASKYDVGHFKLSDILGYTVMASGNAYCTIDNLIDRMEDLNLFSGTMNRAWGFHVHQEVLNPMQTQVITIYRILNDQQLIEHIDLLVEIFYQLKLLREIASTLTQEVNLQNFGLKFHNDFHLLDDEWVDRFSMERSPGEIFLYPTQIGYDYDNIMVDIYDDEEFNAVKMTSNSFDLVEQQCCYTGELMFWCGDSRDHDTAWRHLEYSLNNYWGGYKIKKTDIRNRFNMLTWGMIKVGSFDIVPPPGFNKVVRYDVIG